MNMCTFRRAPYRRYLTQTQKKKCFVVCAFVAGFKGRVLTYFKDIYLYQFFPGV